MTISSVERAVRASPLEKTAIARSKSSAMSIFCPPKPRSSCKARWQPQHIVLRQRVQHEHAAARQQGAVDLKGRVFGRRADEDDAPLLDVGQKSVLLRLIEAVDFVHEHNRADAEMPVTFRLLHHLPDFLDAAGDGGEVDEMALRLMGDNLRERGFTHARRPPEIMEDTKSPSIMRRRTLPLPISLSGKLIEVLRAKALRQRRGGIRGGQEGFLRHCSSLSFGGFLRSSLLWLIALVAEGFASAEATRGQRKQTNLVAPLTPSTHTHVSWSFMLQGDSHAARLMRSFAPFRQQNPNFRHQQHQHEQYLAEQSIGAACLRNRGNAQNRQKGKREQHIPEIWNFSDYRHSPCGISVSSARQRQAAARRRECSTARLHRHAVFRAEIHENQSRRRDAEAQQAHNRHHQLIKCFHVFLPSSAFSKHQISIFS